jgi:hypothetical protein
VTILKYFIKLRGENSMNQICAIFIAVRTCGRCSWVTYPETIALSNKTILSAGIASSPEIIP